jgi:chromosome segregation ATPase
MAQTLPPFARALQGRRTQGDHRRSAPEDPPEADPVPPTEIEASPGELLELQVRVATLESQNADLLTEIKRLQRAQLELDTERQLSSECRRQLDETIGQLRDEQLKCKYLQAQVQQLEGLLDSKKQLTDVKEQMLQRFQSEYQSVMTDYKRILELNGVQTGQLRRARVEIAELEAQVEELKGLSKRRPSESPILPRPSPEPFRDFPVFDAEPFTPESPIEPEMPDPDFERVQSPRRIEPIQLPKRSPLKRAALVDNINFGGEPSEIIGDDVESMTTEELKDLLSVLRMQREEVERRLNRAPEKGRLMAHVRMEQEEREHELDVLSKRIAKIRFALRKAHEF